MSEINKSHAPFSGLGRQLKNLRMKRRESLAEVSGAVEIDIDVLSAIEHGSQRPNEEILLLLCSHFQIKEDEADKLWGLAGYDIEPEVKATLITPEDMRIVYTDMVHVTVNNFGVVMNFMQNAGQQPVAISRVGMSREHAEKVLELLQKTLAATKPKSLPAPQPPADTQES